MLLYYNLFVHISSKNFAPGFSFPKAVAKVVPFLQPTKLFPNLFAKKSLLAHSQQLTTFKHTKNYIVKHIFHPKRPSFLTVWMSIRNSTNGVFFVKGRKSSELMKNCSRKSAPFRHKKIAISQPRNCDFCIFQKKITLPTPRRARTRDCSSDAKCAVAAEAHTFPDFSHYILAVWATLQPKAQPVRA